MKITLKVPYTVGDLAPTDAYPHVYITTLYVNGPGLSVTVQYEVGTMSPPTNDTPLGAWVKAQLVPTQSLQITGDALFPFFTTPVQPANDGSNGAPVVSGALWDQVETLLYAQIQSTDTRMAGDVA